MAFNSIYNALRMANAGGANIFKPVIAGSPATITNNTGSAATDIAVGATLATLSVTGLTGGVWTIESNSYFSINASTGVLVTKATLVNGSFSPRVTYTVTSGNKVSTVSDVVALTITTATAPVTVTGDNTYANSTTVYANNSAFSASFNALQTRLTALGF